MGAIEGSGGAGDGAGDGLSVETSPAGGGQPTMEWKGRGPSILRRPFLLTSDYLMVLSPLQSAERGAWGVGRVREAGKSSATGGSPRTFNRLTR